MKDSILRNAQTHSLKYAGSFILRKEDTIEELLRDAFESGYLQAIDDVYEERYDEGFQDGKEEGYEEGFEDGHQITGS